MRWTSRARSRSKSLEVETGLVFSSLVWVAFLLCCVEALRYCWGSWLGYYHGVGGSETSKSMDQKTRDIHHLSHFRFGSTVPLPPLEASNLGACVKRCCKTPGP